MISDELQKEYYSLPPRIQGRIDKGTRYVERLGEKIKLNSPKGKEVIKRKVVSTLFKGGWKKRRRR